MSLYQKVRPISFAEVAGNDDVVRLLTALTTQDDPPHAYLLTGPSGCGKTTIGRIIALSLGIRAEDVVPNGTGDYRELDSVHFRGIDTMRDIRESSQYMALRGARRCWLLDECFARGTRVATPVGEVPIQDIRSGDYVYNLVGSSRVLRVFRNIVPVGRIVRLGLSNGRTVFTTIDHLFRLLRGQWRKAGLLRVGDLLLSLSHDIMHSMNCEIEIRNAVKSLSGVRDSIPSQESRADVLFSHVRLHAGETIEVCAVDRAGAGVPGVWEGLCSQKVQQSSTVLLTDLWKKGKRSRQNSYSVDATMRGVWESDTVFFWSEEESRDVRESLRDRSDWAEEYGADEISGRAPQDSHCYQERAGYEYPLRETASSVEFRAHDAKQSVSNAWGNREGQGDETNQGITACLEGRARWEWEADDPPDDARYVAGVADGGRCADWARPVRWQRISDLLQGGHRERVSETRDRGGRQGTSVSECQGEGREEGAQVGGVRVESVEVYQPGRGNENFRCVVGDRERDCGFAVFYDLEVEADPSYFAERVAVHNCHELPKLSQDALLKGLEDPPPHVYFVLCTTMPESLQETIKSRCSIHRVSPLSEQHMVALLHRIASGEGEKLSRPQLRAIHEKTDGKPRAAIQLLESVLAVPLDARDAVVAAAESVKAKVDNLAREMMRRTGWKAVAAILADVQDDDVETVRRGVLGYVGKVLLGDEDEQAAAILYWMRDPFFNSGKSGLIHACYCAVKPPETP